MRGCVCLREREKHERMSEKVSERYRILQKLLIVNTQCAVCHAVWFKALRVLRFAADVKEMQMTDR